MKKILYIAVIAALFAVIGSTYGTQTASAVANPNLINFQGKVVNSDGTNVTNGSYTFRFRLYTSTAPTDAGNACSANTCKWEESKTVTVTNGVFQTELGDTTTMIDVSLYTDLYLGIKFNNDAQGEMSPRVHLDSVPYALNSDKLGGIGAAGFVQLGATQSGNINIGAGTLTSGAINGQTVSSAAIFTGTVNIQGASALTLGVSSTATGAAIFKSIGGANTVTLQAPITNPTASYVLRLPTTGPALSQCLANDGTTVGQLTFQACGGGGGDNISVNGTSATDANFLNTTGTSSVTGVTFALNAVSTPDDITVAIANATTTTAGAVTAGSQTFGGDKSFQSVGSNSVTAFAVQNVAGTSLLNIDTTDTNLATNPGFEVNATGWVAASTTAPTRVTTNQYLGVASGAVSGVTAAGEGFKQVLSSTLANGTYTISWYDRLVSGPAFTDVMAAYSTTGGAPVNCTGINTQTVVNTGWTRHWCTFVVAGASAANYITIRQVALSTARTWNIDAVQIELGATPSAYGAGSISLNSNIVSAINFKNEEDSTTAFQVQTASGTNLATFDTLNSGLTFAGDTTLNAQKDLRFADSDSSNWVAFQSAATVASNVTWTLPSADSAGCLKSDGSGTLSFAACGDTNIQTFSISGNYTVPTNALMVIIEAWGGGGGGGGGAGGTSAAARTGGGGGGGGAYNTDTLSASTLGIAGATIPVTVGAGGAGGTGGAGTTGQLGSLGNPTCFSTTTGCAGTIYLQTYGGGGGSGNSAAGNGGGGGGGVLGASVSANTAAGTSGGFPLGGAGGNPAGNATGGGGAGGATAAVAGISGGYAERGGGGGGASTTTGTQNSGIGGGSVQGGGGGGAGGSCAVTTCTLRAGGAGGKVPGTSGGGGAAGTTAGQAGGAGSAGVGSGGDGGGGGATNTGTTVTGGIGGVGGARGGGGGGGGGATGSTAGTGGAGGAGGAGYLRTWTLRGQGADLAEIYCTNDPSLIAGDAVSIDTTLKAGVQKTAHMYDPNAIGIISTSPGLVIGNVEEDCAKPVLVALAGRVPLSVSLENGPIKPGDSLTASSTPGVAMKATKSGSVIGQAMTGYDATMPEGFVVAFVQNHQSNGVGLSEIPGLNNDSEVPVSQQALEYLVAQKDAAIAHQYASEISTDRLIAGLEVITPSVVTDALTTNSIGSSGGGDISFILNGDNKLVVKGREGAPGFTVDATGNATFGVSLVSLGDIESKGGLTVYGDALFGGKATFSKLAQFEGDIKAMGRITQNNDAGGLAKIPKGATRVNIVFDREYERPPIVGITLVADQVLLPDGSVEDAKRKEQRLFGAGYSYLISNSTTKGFTIVLNHAATEDLQFTWNALAIDNPKTTVGTMDQTLDTQNSESTVTEGH